MAYYAHNYVINANFLVPRENDDDHIVQENSDFRISTFKEHTIEELGSMIRALYNIKYVAIKSLSVEREEI